MFHAVAALFWFLTLLSGVALLTLIWNRPPREGRRKPLLLPAIGTCLVIAAAGGVLALSLWAHVSGLRPSHPAALGAWCAALAVLAGVSVLKSWGAPRASSRKLFAAFGITVLASLGAYFGMDLVRRAGLERRLAATAALLESFKPPPLSPGLDARPIYEKAFELLGDRGQWPEWIEDPEAMRSSPEDLRAFLESKREGLAVARTARGLAGYSVDHPLLEFRRESDDPKSDPTAFTLALMSLGKLIGLRCLTSARERDLETVQDHIGWLGDIARQMSRDVEIFTCMGLQSLARHRAAVLEEALAMLGPSGQTVSLNFPAVPDAALDRYVRASIEREALSATYSLIAFYLGKVDLEVVLESPDRPFFPEGPLLRMLSGEWLRFYRVFVLPIDLRALENHLAVALRKVGRLERGESASPTLAEHIELGSGLSADVDISTLHLLASRFRQTRTVERLAAVGLAVHRFGAQRGRYPKTLVELVPHYLSAIPVDACLERPLEYRETDGGAVVFSTWDGRSGEPMADLDGGGGIGGPEPAWKRLLQGSGRNLVFILGSAWDKYRATESVGEDASGGELRSAIEAGSEKPGGQEGGVGTSPERQVRPGESPAPGARETGR